jgi:hypothetical protein
MPRTFPHIHASRQIALLLAVLLVVAALAAVTLAAQGAEHHTLMSPTCPTCLSHGFSLGRVTLA